MGIFDSANFPRIGQLLDQQNQPTVDPFVVARQQWDQQQQIQAGEPQVQNTSQLNQMSSLPPQQQQGSAQNALAISAPSNTQPSSAVGLFKTGSTQDKAQYDASKLPQTLQKLGINNRGIALNQLGRVQLMGRLQSKFGREFQQHPDALNALSVFDSEMKRNPQSLTSAITRGQRTLKALLGGGE